MLSSCSEWIQEISKEVNVATIVDETATLYIFQDLTREAGGVIPLTVGPTGCPILLSIGASPVARRSSTPGRHSLRPQFAVAPTARSVLPF